MYAPAKVANTSAWIALVNKPNNINGIGTTNGTRATKTPTTNSSARIFPKSRKLNDNGFVKSSKILIGNKNAAGCT
jgi:hypothetical protein